MQFGLFNAPNQRETLLIEEKVVSEEVRNLFRFLLAKKNEID